MIRLLRVGVTVFFLLLLAGAADWPQWGGHDHRNAVSSERGLPDSFSPGEKGPKGGIDRATARNVKWIARLGSAAYGNPTVAAGRVYVGTDDLTVADDSRFRRTRGGMVKCFEEAIGKLLWQLAVPERTRYDRRMLYGHQYLGTCSSPTVDGDRVYVVTNGADIVCLDVRGLADGNQGPFRDEGQYMVGPDHRPVSLKPTDADILWRFDPIEQLGIHVHDTASCSALVYGDLVYVSTSNGVDASHEHRNAPDAPAFIALDKRTGRLAARENDGLSARLFHCQWASPSLAVVKGKPQILLGGGDGVCYAFEALDHSGEGVASLKKVWWYNCNPPEYRLRDGKPIRYIAGDKRKKDSPNKNDGSYVGPSEIIATPVFHKNRVYVAIGQDPAHGRGRGMLHCIDATRTGDVTESGRIWTYGGLDRSIATASVADGLVYITDIAGRLHCLEADTGRPVWVYETKAETWGGALVADGKLYFGTQKNLYIMAAGRQMRLLDKIRLGSPVYSTPIAANGAVYAASQHYLWAVANGDQPGGKSSQ